MGVIEKWTRNETGNWRERVKQNPLPLASLLLSLTHNLAHYWRANLQIGQLNSLKTSTEWSGFCARAHSATDFSRSQFVLKTKRNYYYYFDYHHHYWTKISLPFRSTAPEQLGNK